MKNLVVLVFICCIALVSCKKKYTCTCYSPMIDKWVDTEIEKGSKNAAEKECKSFNGDPAVDGSINCHLK